MREKCHPDDPRRCQRVMADGQCEFLAEPDTEFCRAHLTVRKQVDLKRERQNRYLIESQYLKEGYHRQSEGTQILDMKDEICLLRALIEKRVNAVRGEDDIKFLHGPISQLMQRLESMSVSLYKMQQQLGLVLGKDALRELAKEIASILDEELEGVSDKMNRLDRISDRICDAIERAGTPSEEK